MHQRPPLCPTGRLPAVQDRHNLRRRTSCKPPLADKNRARPSSSSPHQCASGFGRRGGRVRARNCPASPSAASTTCAESSVCFSPCCSRTRRGASYSRLFSSFFERIARVSGKNAAPASMAARMRAASKTSRDKAALPDNGTWADRPPDARQRLFSGTARRIAARSPKPASSSSRPARPLRQQPHTFQRGNAARSTNSTSTPRRANSRAAVAPAGPAPTTITPRVRSAASSSVVVAVSVICDPISANIEKANASPRSRRAIRPAPPERGPLPS